MKRGLVMLAVLVLAACNQSEAPADKLEKAAETLVEEAQEVQPPVLAGPLAPRDECSELDGAGEFYRRLDGAVKARDADAFADLAAEDVKLDFGGGSGRDELRRRLSAEDGELWADLDELMTLGCDGDRQKGITLPWYFAQEIPGDPARLMIVIGENVPLRSAPERDAGILRPISWEAVQLTRGEQPTDAYRSIELPDGTTGFMEASRLRSILDYRLQAISRNGNWRITSLVAGD